MSTFFFTAKNGADTAANELKTILKKLQEDQSIDNWQWNEGGEPLAIETTKLSSEELKHLLRESGVDVEFTKAPGAV
jgi:hypothetical protein